MNETTNRPIHEVANEILSVWKGPYFGAVPYLKAMLTLDTKYDAYGYDTAVDIVLRFLSNASTFRGKDARRIKSELRTIIDL
jgi:hypothetical protein